MSGRTRGARPFAARRLGFTLIEVLAAIALIASVTAVALIGVRGALDGAAVREASDAVRDLDWRARAMARRGEPVRLVALRGGGGVAIVTHPGATTVATRELRPGVALRLVDADGAPLDAVLFGADGRSADYRALIAHREVEVAWHVAGLSGLVREEAP